MELWKVETSEVKHNSPRQGESFKRSSNNNTASPGGWVGALEVINQLRQVLDGVDVVVRGRGDETHAGDGVPCVGDFLRHFVAWELAACGGGIM